MSSLKPPIIMIILVASPINDHQSFLLYGTHNHPYTKNMVATRLLRVVQACYKVLTLKVVTRLFKRLQKYKLVTSLYLSKQGCYKLVRTTFNYKLGCFTSL